jgi:hypothetical protein
MERTRSGSGDAVRQTPAERLLHRLFDDAALFPPGNAPMATAVRDHRGHAATWYADTVGPFLCTDARLPELSDQLAREPGPPLPLAVIATGDVRVAVEAARRVRGAQLVGIEVAVPGGREAEQLARQTVAALGQVLPAGITASVEVPRGEGQEEVLDLVARAGLQAKLRTGGTTGAAFPDERELARFLRGCLDRGLVLKLTAGLHHAVRHTGRGTGFEHHGVLNVLAAVAAGRGGATASELAAVLADRDPGTLVRRVAQLGADAVAGVRGTFASIGTCDVHEPLADLVALRVLDGPALVDVQGSRG